MRKTLRRGSVSTFFANVPRCLVGMEASNGAHYWARVLTNLGHKVRLISPQFVAPYVKSNKTDRNDAEAICEAVGRPTMRFVPRKSPSGGRNRLFGISKRGDRYLRTLMIHGARAAHGKAGGKQDPRSRWLVSLRQRRHPNVAAVALANKNARIAWAMLAGNVSYEPARSVQAA
jgi:transposase